MSQNDTPDYWMLQQNDYWGWLTMVIVLWYSGITSSIPMLQMAWVIASPGHKKPRYWLYRINESLSYMSKDFDNLREMIWFQTCSFPIQYLKV